MNPIVAAMWAILAVTETHLGKFRDAGFLIVEIVQEIGERLELGKGVHRFNSSWLLWRWLCGRRGHIQNRWPCGRRRFQYASNNALERPPIQI